jgi:hypothetical protein
MKRGARRSWEVARGGLLVAAAAAVALALASYRPTDAALNTAAAGPVRNWLGTPGAWTSDLLLTLWGLARSRCSCRCSSSSASAWRACRRRPLAEIAAPHLLGHHVLDSGTALLSGRGGSTGFQAGWAARSGWRWRSLPASASRAR